LSFQYIFLVILPPRNSIKINETEFIFITKKTIYILKKYMLSSNEFNIETQNYILCIKM